MDKKTKRHITEHNKAVKSLETMERVRPYAILGLFLFWVFWFTATLWTIFYYAPMWLDGFKGMFG